MTGWRRWAASTTLRLVALLVALQLLAAGAVLLYARYAIASQFTRDQQLIVGELESNLVDWYRTGGSTAVAREIDRRLGSLKGENIVVLLTDRDGRRLAGNLDAWPTVVPASAPWRTIELFRIGSDQPERLGIRAATLPGGERLLTGRVIEGDLRFRDISERVMLAAFLLAVPLALLVGGVMSRAIDRRITGIADTATAVGDGELGRRVPLDGSGDSFDVLGGKVNAMLEQIETLVSELRIVTGGLAHDLRTPILRLTATLEQAAGEVRDPVALGAITRVQAEAEILLSMLAMALQISQAEAGIGRNRFDDVDVAALLGDIAELYEPAAEAQGITLAASAAPLTCRLHRELVSQAIGNLVDNAMKYAGARHITLAAERVADGVQLTVADDGIGIAADDREKAMRRFGRLDASRHTSGAGLGLSLVEAVARLHNGRLELADNAPGLKVVLTLAC